ncbi:MAG: hypothetical protein KJZ93_04665 [Caldilineaceae bacterium]|nr:hypothetical protein [Caldilineaceae bacterium]
MGRLTHRIVSLRKSPGDQSRRAFLQGGWQTGIAILLMVALLGVGSPLGATNQPDEFVATAGLEDPAVASEAITTDSPLWLRQFGSRFHEAPEDVALAPIVLTTFPMVCTS